MSKSPSQYINARPYMIYGPALDSLKAAASAYDARPKSAIADTYSRGHSLPVAQLGTTAIISIHGPIHGDETMLNALIAYVFGGVGQTEIAAALMSAVGDSSVKSIVLDIDSPGGEALGTGELAAMIRGAAGMKPVTAYVSGMGCSAAYYLASACGRIVCDASAMLGSIGTVVCFVDDTEAMKKAGPKDIEIVSTQSPHKRPDPSTPAGKLAYQEMVDELTHVFIADVAKYRNVSDSKVMNDFGGGGILIGSHAVKVGLADAVGSIKTALSGAGSVPLVGGKAKPAPTTQRAIAAKPTATATAKPVAKTPSPVVEVKPVISAADMQAIFAKHGLADEPKPGPPPVALSTDEMWERYYKHHFGQ
jgi:signal peptide peptidase SppA